MALQPAQGVRFHDGAPFTADDVVFSIERAQEPTSQIAQYARALGKVTKIDDCMIELHRDKPDPLLLEHVNTIYIMNRAWCIAHHVLKPLADKAREETFASCNANGTGPSMLKTRAVGPSRAGPQSGLVGRHRVIDALALEARVYR